MEIENSFLKEEITFLKEESTPLKEEKSVLQEENTSLKEEKKILSYKLPKLMCHLDAEWGSDGSPICFQVLLTGPGTPPASYLVFDEKYKEFLAIKGYRGGFNYKHNVRILFRSFQDKDDNLTWLIQYHCVKHGLLPTGLTENDRVSVPVNLYLFYSPKDLWIALGFENFKEIALGTSKKSLSRLDQKRSLSGSFVRSRWPRFSVSYKIKDLSGWTNSGLKNLGDSLEIETSEKDLLDPYKTCMENGLVKETEAFIKYAINDVVLLQQVIEGQVNLVNWVVEDILQLPLSYSQEGIPMTQGSLVNDIFFSFLRGLLKDSQQFQDCPDKEALLLLAFAKLGILNVSAPGYKKYLNQHHEWFQKRSLKEFLDEFNNPRKLAKIQDFSSSYRKRYEYHAVSSASIPYFMKYYGNSTGVFNALVSGGRTINERFWETSRDFCADIDLASCYGSALREFTYPIGLPEVYARSPNQKGITLGEFLKTTEKKLVPNTYKIVVSGKLSFSQDLVFSKLTSEAQMKTSFYGEERKFTSAEAHDRAHLDADFVLLRNEIQNGVITSDVLELLRAVCSNGERKEFYGLDVVLV